MSEHDEMLGRLRADLRRVREDRREEPRITLDELAERDLRLKARVDVVRAAIPGPALREPEPPIAPEETA